MFNVSNCRQRDRAYFDALYDERDNGGLGALLHTLQTWDISRFDVRDVPETEGLTQQKLEGLKGVTAFWFGLLMNGEMPTEVGFEEKTGSWGEVGAKVSVDAMYAAYKDWYKDRRGQGHGILIEKEQFGTEISKMCPRRKRTRMTDGKRSPGYKYPSLDECRMEFSTQYGNAIQWPELYMEDDDIADLI